MDIETKITLRMPKDDGYEKFSYLLGQKPVGSGTYSEVYEANYIQEHPTIVPISGLKCAIKIFDPENYESLGKNNCESLQDLDRKSFIYPYSAISADAEKIVDDLQTGKTTTEKVKVVVMPYFEGKNLLEHINGFPQRKISGLKRQKWVIKTLCELIDKLHKEGVIHCDIKPDNIHYQPNKGEGVFRLCDFDFSQIIGSSGEFPLIGTYSFMAPEIMYNTCLAGAAAEILKASHLYGKPVINYLQETKKIDIWSMLSTLFTVFSGKYLFPDKVEVDAFINSQCTLIKKLCENPTDEKAFQNFQKLFFKAFEKMVFDKVKKALDISLDEPDIANDLQNFFLWALKADPDQRRTIAEILEKADLYFPAERPESVTA